MTVLNMNIVLAFGLCIIAVIDTPSLWILQYAYSQNAYIESRERGLKPTFSVYIASRDAFLLQKLVLDASHYLALLACSSERVDNEHDREQLE